MWLRVDVDKGGILGPKEELLVLRWGKVRVVDNAVGGEIDR